MSKKTKGAPAREMRAAKYIAECNDGKHQAMVDVHCIGGTLHYELSCLDGIDQSEVDHHDLVPTQSIGNVDPAPAEQTQERDVNDEPPFDLSDTPDESTHPIAVLEKIDSPWRSDILPDEEAK